MCIPLEVCTCFTRNERVTVSMLYADRRLYIVCRAYIKKCDGLDEAVLYVYNTHPVTR